MYRILNNHLCTEIEFGKKEIIWSKKILSDKVLLFALTQLGKADHVDTRWLRSRSIRMTITHDWSPLALAFSAVKSRLVNALEHLQKVVQHDGVQWEVQHYCLEWKLLIGWQTAGPITFHKLPFPAVFYLSISKRVQSLQDSLGMTSW